MYLDMGSNFILKVAETYKLIKKRFFGGYRQQNYHQLLLGLILSTPQPPYRLFSFAWQITYGGFAWYLLLSPIPSAGGTLLGFYHRITWQYYYPPFSMLGKQRFCKHGKPDE
jgi:hypothetical protein